MSEIHSTAIVAPGATIGAGARIGPFCTVGAEAVLGAGVSLISHVVVDGHTRIGDGASLYPFCTVGLAPQDLKYRGEPTMVEVGARTQIREHVTIHRGTVTGSSVTRVGNDCLLMNTVHVAHDCEIGDGVIIANNVVMGGHVYIGANAVIGGAAAIHQFVHIGRGAMVGGVSGVEADVIPFGEVIGNRARLRGLNLIGLKRRGFQPQQIQALRGAFRMLFRGPGVFAEQLTATRKCYAGDALIDEVLDFIEARQFRGAGKRGLIRTRVVDEDEDA